MIIVVLLLTNMAVLGYFLWFKKQEKHPVSTERDRSNGIADMLQKDVGFNDAQVAQYKQMKDRQRETIRPMYDDMRKAKDGLFRLLKDTTVSDAVISQAADSIAWRQRQLDLQTFHYFRRVRTLCTPDQVAKYDVMIQNMFSKMGRPPRKDDEKKK